MGKSVKFGNLLTDGVYKIKLREGKPLSVLQDELGHALEREGGSCIQHWRRGNTPSKLSDLETLARKMVTRGQVERAWLLEFLLHGDHPNPADLCDELFPGDISEPDVPQDSRLPSKNYRFLVGRQRLVDEIISALQDCSGRWIVSIDGQGGIGKTALALDVTEQCQKKQLFTNVVWISAAPKEFAYGSGQEKWLTFENVLDAIGLQLGDNDLGVVATHRGDYTQAEKYLLEGLRVARQSQESKIASTLLQSLGVVADQRGEYAQAEAFYQEGLTLARQIGDPETINALLTNLGVLADQRGEYTQAEAFYQESLTLARKLGYNASVSILLTNLGAQACTRGVYEQAEIYLQEALTVGQDIGYREVIIVIFHQLGVLATKQEDYTQAETFYRKSIALARKMEERRYISATLYELGELHIKQQKFDLASRVFLEALEIARELDVKPWVANALYGLAQVAAAQSNIVAACRQGQESLAIFEAIGYYRAAEVKEWLAEVVDSSE